MARLPAPGLVRCAPVAHQAGRYALATCPRGNEAPMATPPPEPPARSASQNALDAVTVVVAVILTTGAVYVIARQQTLPDWYPVLLGTVVSFAFGRASAR